MKGSKQGEISPATNKPTESDVGRVRMGAFKNLLVRYPDIKDMLIQLLLTSRPGRVRTSPWGITDVHCRFLLALRNKGLTDADYPFCTRDKGRSSLRRLQLDLQAAVSDRLPTRGVSRN